MAHNDKSEQKPSPDKEGARSQDPGAAVRETVKNELSEDALQDVTGGCATGEHMPTV